MYDAELEMEVIDLPDMEMGGVIDSYTKEQADEKFQEKLTEQQLQNIEDVQNKAPKSTTLEGYGITDAYNKKQADEKFQEKLSEQQLKNISDVTNKQNQLSDEQIKNINDVQNKVAKEQGKGLSSNDYTTEEKQAVAKISDKADVSYVKNTFANALKGTASGEGAVGISDVSSNEHTMGVCVRSKNLITKVIYADVTAGVQGAIISADTLTLKKGKTYTLSFDTENTGVKLYFLTTNKPLTLIGSNATTADGTRKSFSFTTTADYALKSYAWLIYTESSSANSGLCSNAMIEEGTTATEYTPYVDVSAVSVKKCGKNLYKIGEASHYDVPNSQTLTITEDSITATAGSGGSSYAYNTRFNYTFGKYAIGAVSNGNDVRMLVRCYDENRNILTKDNITISGWTYNSYYQGWYGGNKAVDIPDTVAYWNVGMVFSADSGTKVTISNILVAKDTEDLTYETYKEPVTYTPNADGTVEGVTSLYPSTTLMADTNGIIVDCEYNRDINKAFAELEEKLTNAVISLGGNV